jgi:hypothetical protein
MRGLCIVVSGLALGFAQLGCRDNSPPPPRMPVPAAKAQPTTLSRDQSKPMPAPANVESAAPEYIPPGYDDVPLVNQRPPEEEPFVRAYKEVGRPRITVFVNRTLEGDLIPVNANVPVAGVGTSDHKDAVAIYLRPGEYDEASARSIDYQAIESILTDWLGASGQVAIVSPTMARDVLTDQQVKDLQSGRPQVLREIAKQLDADVLVQVQARPTKQTENGLGVRVIAEAMNTRGGESLGRAVVDIPPPLEKTTLNRYTRFMARKLMDEMINAWLNNPPPRNAAQAPLNAPGAAAVTSDAAAPSPTTTTTTAPTTQP